MCRTHNVRPEELVHVRNYYSLVKFAVHARCSRKANNLLRTLSLVLWIVNGTSQDFFDSRIKKRSEGSVRNFNDAEFVNWKLYPGLYIQHYASLDSHARIMYLINQKWFKTQKFLRKSASAVCHDHQSVTRVKGEDIMPLANGGQCRRWRDVGCKKNGKEGWRGLINETYPAAADTKMHCKYCLGKTIVPEWDLCLSQLHSRRATQFFPAAGQSDGSPFLHLHRECNKERR